MKDYTIWKYKTSYINSENHEINIKSQKNTKNINVFTILWAYTTWPKTPKEKKGAKIQKKLKIN